MPYCLGPIPPCSANVRGLFFAVISGPLFCNADDAGKRTLLGVRAQRCSGTRAGSWRVASCRRRSALRRADRLNPSDALLQEPHDLMPQVHPAHSVISLALHRLGRGASVSTFKLGFGLLALLGLGAEPSPLLSTRTRESEKPGPVTGSNSALVDLLTLTSGGAFPPRL